MAYLHTDTILEVLAARLRTITVDPAGTGKKLYKSVELFGAAQLAEALKSTFEAQDEVCFVVPGGDQHTGEPQDQLEVVSRRHTRVCLLISDRAFDLGGNDALVGGRHGTGVLPMKDRTIDDLTDNPIQIEGHPGFSVVPSNGEMFVLENEKPGGGTLGRECWQQWVNCYAGTKRIVLP